MGNMDLLAIAPEITLLLGAVLVLMVAVGSDLGSKAWAWIAGLSLTLAWVFSVWQWRWVDGDGAQLSFGLDVPQVDRLPMIVTDHFSAFAGIAIFLVAGIALAGGWKLVDSLGGRGAEFVALALLAVAGMHLMTNSANLILLFMALETASIALYVIAGFTRKERNSDEAAMKYFLLGSFASAIFVYGVALMFAATGSTSLYGSGGIDAFFTSVVLIEDGVLMAAIALIIVGLGFKVSAAPFHQWAPDVYQGAAGGAVALMASGVKIAGFAALARILVGALSVQIGAWAPALAVIAALSVIVGTGFAIAQDDLKRMLAYSGVAHAGFIMTALVDGGGGIPAMWFYVVTYAVELVGVFTVIAVIGGYRTGAFKIESLAGLSQRSPSLALAMSVLMLALAGIPLTAGFVSKFVVFAAAIDAGYTWLVVVGLVTAVGGLYFYLRTIAVMYFKSPVPVDVPGATRGRIPVGWASGIVIWLAVGATVFAGIDPWPLLELARHALPL